MHFEKKGGNYGRYHQFDRNCFTSTIYCQSNYSLLVNLVGVLVCGSVVTYASSFSVVPTSRNNNLTHRPTEVVKRTSLKQSDRS